ncbi:hypothetical protein GCM10009793_09660 [Brachybacterium phenoliresistens]
MYGSCTPREARKALNIAVHARMCTMAVGVITPSRSKRCTGNDAGWGEGGAAGGDSGRAGVRDVGRGDPESLTGPCYGPVRERAGTRGMVTVP